MMSDRPSIELSTVQVVASMGAAVTGAFLTSYLGNGGTIVGTAVGAGASTAGFAVYKHYLARTKEKVAPVIVEHARHWSPVTGTQTSQGTSPDEQGTAARTVTSPYRAANGTAGNGAAGNGATLGNGATAGHYAPGASTDQTQPMHARDPGAPDHGDAPTRDFSRGEFGRGGFGPGESGPRDPGPRDAEQADTETARPFGTVRMGSTGHEGNGGPGDFTSGGPGKGRDAGGPGKHSAAHGGGISGALRDRPRWLIVAATSAAVFLVALLVITLIEFGTGKPIDASVWGRKASGTTLGNVTGSHSQSGTVSPTVSPTPTQSATPGGVGQTAPQPSSGATTGPTPSSVPSVSTAPSQSAHAASVAPTVPGQKAGQ
jgi:hypothetical protein